MALFPKVTVTIVTFVIALAWGFNDAVAQTVACPQAEGLTGYTTIASINNDMRAELARISDGEKLPEDSYTYTLCPQTIFDVSNEPLQPILSDVSFACGSNGEANDSCVLFGGSQQVLIVDSLLNSYPLERITFSGLTFSGFNQNSESRGTAIAAFASKPTSAIFRDALFRDFMSDFVILQSTGEPGSEPMMIEINDSIVNGGTTGVFFDNDGGFLNIRNIQVEGLNAASFIATANGGVSRLRESSISKGSLDSITYTTNSAEQQVADVNIFSMSRLADAFYAEQEGSGLVVRNVSLFSNDLSPMEWTAISAQSGAIVEVVGSTISGNSGLLFALQAGIGSAVSITDSSINQNTAASSTSASIFVIGGSAIVERSEFTQNFGFSGEILAFLGGSVELSQSCIQDSRSDFVAFADSQSTVSGENAMNFVGSYESSFCTSSGPRLFREDVGAGCFVGGLCTGTCRNIADASECMARAATPTSSPTNFPNSVLPTVTSTGQPDTSIPSFTPGSFVPNTQIPIPTVDLTFSPTTDDTLLPTRNSVPESTNLPTLEVQRPTLASITTSVPITPPSEPTVIPTSAPPGTTVTPTMLPTNVHGQNGTPSPTQRCRPAGSGTMANSIGKGKGDKSFKSSRDSSKNIRTPEFGIEQWVDNKLLDGRHTWFSTQSKEEPLFNESLPICPPEESARPTVGAVSTKSGKGKRGASEKSSKKGSMSAKSGKAKSSSTKSKKSSDRSSFSSKKKKGGVRREI
ncbi:predicted protein [Phaeodactylum tricornutum CCAP 1055/1]|uniref:Uncharacterized protein n=3 Tax=Phaeodactylum tricornutum TaxID=2850 RepID=B7GDV3_PHATC|nr:predicted protein [Phaeodactylum tricornutum CCAP 1055/1]EEC43188.1 predicted protein [Phaeodactylum tricornutum CCAP 1055/1]|eukprot:XP_002185319.1 predicted protein [Phaeodactylum tricornutum CCAP 1055/1]